MALSQSYDITICNWNSYQPRKDLKSLSWIRIDSDIFFSENFFLLDNNQKILFFYVLTYAGKKNTDTYSFNPEFVSANLKVGIKQLNEGIEKLESLGIVRRLVTNSSRISTDLCTTIRYETNDTIHNEQDKTDEVSDFFSFWNLQEKLPKATKLSKARRSKIAQRIKEGGLENLKLAASKISSFPFLLGQNDRKWKADLDWFISNEENSLKVLEGKYQSSQPVAVQGSLSADPLAHHKAQIERFRNKEQSND